MILALAWAFQLTGTINLGVNLGVWLPVLLVLTLAGAAFNMFVMPFMGRSRTSRRAASAAGTSAPVAPAIVATTGAPVAQAVAPAAAAPVAPAVVAPPGAPVAPAVVPPAGTPVSGAAEQEVVQETREKPTL